MQTTPPEELVAVALEALDETYTPYSHFPVGAALLTASGTVFKGINIKMSLLVSPIVQNVLLFLVPWQLVIASLLV